MDYKVIIYAIVAVFLAVIGCYLWVAKHITAKKRHPSSDDIVYTDVCDERSGRLEDCIETEVRNVHHRLDDMKGDMKEARAENTRRFDRLEDLIKNGG